MKESPTKGRKNNELQQARRLLQRLDLPAGAAKVLLKPQYWTETFCRLFFERCDDLIFERPRQGLEVAEVAPLLARRVPDEHCGARGQKVELVLRGMSVLASAFRATGELGWSRRLYEGAFELADSENVSARGRAHLLQRLAVLEINEGALEEASQHAGRAVEMIRDTEFEEDLGAALTIHGFVQMSRKESSAAVKSLSEALTRIDCKRDPRIFYSATHNLAVTLLDASSIDHLSDSCHYLSRARKLIRGRGTSLPKLKLSWLEGLIMVRVGSTRRGEVLYKTARQGFVELAVPYELALVSLDLACLYHDEGRVDDLLEIALETHAQFRALSDDEKAAAALDLWMRAARAKVLSREILRAARQTVHQRAGLAS